MSTLCFSTLSLPDESFLAWCQRLSNTSFTGIELAISPQQLLLSDSVWKSTVRIAKAHNLQITNIHLGHPSLASEIPHEPGLASASKPKRQKKQDIVKRCADIATLLQCPWLTITSGIRDINEPLEFQVERVESSISHLLDFTAGMVRLGIEQEPEHIIHSTTQLEKLLERFQNRLGINFDIGHSQVLNEDIPQAIQILSASLYNIHFEDIANAVHQHHLFGNGDIQFEPIIESIKKINYKGYLTPDLYPFATQPELTIPLSIAFFKKFNLI